MCSDNRRAGIKFTSSTAVTVKSLTTTNCWFYTSVSSQAIPRTSHISLFFVDIDNVTLEWVSVQNSSVYGFCIVNTFDLNFSNSTFAGGPKNQGGHAYIVYDDQRKRLFRVNIMKSNFTLGLVAGMDFWYFNYNEAEVIIENCNFSHNIVGYGGGVYIETRGIGTIEFHNCTMYNNTSQTYGGGVYIRSHWLGNIEFHDCSIYDNIALQYGAVYFRLHSGGTFEFGNCIIYNNIALQYGAVYFRLHRGGTFEFGNCIIYNNIALQYGVVYFRLHR